MLFTAVDSQSKLGEVPREEAARLRREWLIPVAEATRPPKRVTRGRVRVTATALSSGGPGVSSRVSGVRGESPSKR